MIDFRITSTGDSLDLLPSTTLRLEWSNPIWDFESIPGTLIFPFQLPDTDRNRGLLRYAKVILRHGEPVVMLDAELRLGGLPFLAGKLYVNKSTNRDYQAHFASASGDFGPDIQDLQLRDLDLGGPRDMHPPGSFWTQVMLDTVTAGPWPASDWVFFPVRNYSFGAADESITMEFHGFGNFPGITEICPVQNYWHGGGFYWDWFRAFGQSWGWNRVYTVPLLYVNYILNQIFSRGGYTMAGSWFADPELGTLVLNTLKAWLHDNSAQARPVIVNEGMPDATVVEFLIALRKMFCLGMFFDATRKMVELRPFRDIYSSTAIDDWTDLASPAYELTHEPARDISFKFTRDTADQNLSEETHDLRGQQENPEVIDFSMLPGGDDPGDVRIVLDEFRAYSVNDQPIRAWTFASHLLHDYGPIKGGITIETGFCPLAMFRGYDTIPDDFEWTSPPAPPAFWKIPSIEQEGNYVIAHNIVAPHGLRLLFYRGLVPDSNGDDYPMGSSDNYAWDGTRIAEYSLRWGGDDGLYNVWWRQWAEMMRATQRVNRRARLTISELLSLDMTRRKRIDGVNYFIEKMEVQISMSGIEAAELTLLKD